MSAAHEEDFPAGHPARFDYDPASPEAKEWQRKNVHAFGERDFPVDHVKAVDTPGNTNHISWTAGVDPLNTHLEPFTGRTEKQLAGLRELSRIVSTAPSEPLALEPIDARVANEALAAERKRLGVDSLTVDQHNAVLARLQEERSDE